MRAKAIAAVLALGAIALCALPVAASAKAKHYVVKAQRFATIQQQRGSNGFMFSVVALRKVVDVDVDKAVHPDGVLSADYTAPRRGSLRDGLDVSLGREGRFDLRFVDHKTKEELPSPNCKGAPAIEEKGVFVGSIHFHGLRGFTRLDATRAPGSIFTQGRQVCVRQKVPSNVNSITVGIGTSEADEEGTRLIAGGASGSPRFEAIDFEPKAAPPLEIPPQQTFLASVPERHGAVRVSRSAFLFPSKEATFLSPESLDPGATATVEPPAPFSGSATFGLASPTKAEWSGDLAVELPGLGRVPLTGPGIAAGLCLEGTCTKTLPARLRPPKAKTANAGFTSGFFSE